MKHFLVAYLMFLSLVMPPAAQAEEALTLYGILDAGLQYTQSQQHIVGQSDRGSSLGIATGVQSGSRFGLRGANELGGGTYLRFVLESGFNLANGTKEQGGRMFGRQSTLGLTNVDLGVIDFGRQINLASHYFLPIDPFGEGFGQANIGASFGSANTLRYSNMTLLQSRSMGGLTIGAGYSFSTGLSGIYADNGSCLISGCISTDSIYQYEASNNMRALTLGMKFEHGPLLLSAAYDQLRGSADVPNGPASPNPASWMLGGLYDFDWIKLSAAYGQTRNGSFAGQASGTGATGGALLVSSTLGAEALFASGIANDSYMLGLNVPIGAANFIASWQMMQPAGSYKNDGSASQSIYSAGYLYNFSKRTNLYTYVSFANNFAMVDTARSAMAGVGLRHQF